MKKIIFLFALFASIAANAAVTVTPLGVNYGTKTVTFRVAWTGTPYNNRVWVWVDLCPVAGTSPGTFAQAVISGAAATTGSILTVSGNTRGFYITTNPSTVTATLSNATGQFNWCAYGSDAPPNVTANNGTYTLYGTPPFTLIAADGATTQTVAATTIATSSVTITPLTITDQTGCPGIFCIYTGTDLFIDGTHLCQQRATGAQNWEAWIKDSRDDELYRIVLMPDNKWWLAQNLKYEAEGSTLFQSCGKDSCGRCYKVSNVFNGNYATNQQRVCPPNWVLASTTQWSTMATAISNTVTVAFQDLRSLQSRCTPINDRYGWAAKGVSRMTHETGDEDQWMSVDGSKPIYAGMDQGSTTYSCNSTAYWLTGEIKQTYVLPIRCLRP